MAAQEATVRVRSASEPVADEGEDFLFYITRDRRTFTRVKAGVSLSWGQTWDAVRGFVWTLSDTGGEQDVSSAEDVKTIFSVSSKELFPIHDAWPVTFHANTKALSALWEEAWTRGWYKMFCDYTVRCIEFADGSLINQEMRQVNFQSRLLAAVASSTGQSSGSE